MTPVECEEHYEETGNREFYAYYQTGDSQTIKLRGEVPLYFGFPQCFESEDCERLNLEEDDFDWSPW